MKIQQFVEKVVAGGWELYPFPFLRMNPASGKSGTTALFGIKRDYLLVEVAVERILLDPVAWQGYWRSKNEGAAESTIAKAAHQSMREMVDELNQGGSIDSYLMTL